MPEQQNDIPKTASGPDRNKLRIETITANAVADSDPTGALKLTAHSSREGTNFKAAEPWAGGLLGDEALNSASIIHNKDGSHTIKVRSATGADLLDSSFEHDATRVVEVDAKGHAQIDPSKAMAHDATPDVAKTADTMAKKIADSVNSNASANMKREFKGYTPK